LKRMSVLFALLAVLALASLAVAEDKAPADGKNMCLLYTENCPNQQPTIQQTIQALQAEIKKGPAVYSRAELELLRQKLANAQSLLNWMEYGGR